MGMANGPRKSDGSLTLSLSDAAREIGFSTDTLMRWIEAGHLPIFMPPGHDFGDKRPGPKGYRIWRTDWEAFKRRQTYVGGMPIEAPAVKPSIHSAAGELGGLVRKKQPRPR